MAIKIVNLTKTAQFTETELKQAPKLIVEVKALRKPIKDPATKLVKIDSKGKEMSKIIPGKWVVSILHPNSKLVIHSEHIDCDDFNDAFSIAEKLKNNLPSLLVSIGPYFKPGIDYKTKKPTSEFVEGSFLATYTHPETLETVYTKVIVASDESIALAKATTNEIETEYYDVKFFSSPKKGKTKLHTAKGVVEGDISDEDFENLQEIEDSGMYIDAEAVDFNTNLLKTLQKREEKSEKVKNKAKNKDKKVAKKPNKAVKMEKAPKSKKTTKKVKK